MKYHLEPDDQTIEGTLLEDGEPLATGVAVLHSAGSGSFECAEPPAVPAAEAKHVIRDLQGRLWPVADVCIESEGPVSLRYKLTHTIVYFEVPLDA
jgi:hypothetical protein